MLSHAIEYFTRKTRSLACMSIACGTGNTVHTALGGIASPDGQPVTANSVFDLASLSKLFTGLTAMRLQAEGRLDFEAPVTQYAPQFIHLDGITVSQVLGFEIALRTPERIDAQPDPKAAEATLFACRPFPNGLKAYSDIHAMVARYILEGAADEQLMCLVEQELLRPLGMTNTWCCVPEAIQARCVSHDREHRIEGDRWLVREGITPGTIHDPKARAMAPNGEGLSHLTKKLLPRLQIQLHCNTDEQKMKWFSLSGLMPAFCLKTVNYTHYKVISPFIKHMYSFLEAL